MGVISVEVLANILASVLSLSFAGLASTRTFRDLFRLIKGQLEAKSETASYSEKLGDLTESLTKASREVDEVLLELSQVARDREKTVQQLEADLQALEGREKELKQRVEDLQNVPLPVAEYFAQLTQSGEKRSAKRDYMLFGFGVVVSTVIAILLHALGI